MQILCDSKQWISWILLQIICFVEDFFFVENPDWTWVSPSVMSFSCPPYLSVWVHLMRKEIWEIWFFVLFCFPLKEGLFLLRWFFLELGCISQSSVLTQALDWGTLLKLHLETGIFIWAPAYPVSWYVPVRGPAGSRRCFYLPLFLPFQKRGAPHCSGLREDPGISSSCERCALGCRRGEQWSRNVATGLAKRVPQAWHPPVHLDTP